MSHPGRYKLGCPGSEVIQLNVRLALSKRLRGVLHALRLRGPLSGDPTAQLFHSFLLSLFCWLAVWSAILAARV